MIRSLIGDGANRQRQVVVGLAVVGGAALIAAISLLGPRLWRDGEDAVVAPPQPPRAVAPAPPAQAAWVSPLKQQCSVSDPALMQRLLSLQEALPERTRRLRIAPSNYGPRLARDAYGNAVANSPKVVVLHETVYGLNSAINTFTTHHPNDADQVSYHMLIGEKGEIVQAVDPIRRITTCPLGLAAHGQRLCPLHRRLDDALAAMERAFSSTTLAEILAEPSRSRPLCDFPPLPACAGR